MAVSLLAKDARVCGRPCRNWNKRSARREDHFRAEPAARPELQPTAELVLDERPDNREPCSGIGLALEPGTVVRNREHDLCVPARELHPHRLAPVLERVLEELRE